MREPRRCRCLWGPCRAADAAWQTDDAPVEKERLAARIVGHYEEESWKLSGSLCVSECGYWRLHLGNAILRTLLKKGACALKFRKILSLAGVLLLLSTLSWAGSAYANITVIGTDSEAVVEAIKDMGLSAVVVWGKADGAVICEKTMDGGDDVYGRNLARKLSKSLECIAVYMLDIDAAELVLTTYAYGDQVFDYDSSPGHIKGLDRPPSIQGIENA